MPQIPFVAAAGLLTVALIVGCGQPSEGGATWSDLERRLPALAPAERSDAIERFVVARGGTPIVEHGTTLTFLVRTDADTPPRIVGDFNRWAAIRGGVDSSVGIMSRIPGTSWWTLPGSADADARIEYVVLDADAARPDPLNPRQVDSATGPISEVSMPGWTAQAELDRTEPVPAGTLREERFESAALGGSRRIWVYAAPGYRSDHSTGYASVYVLDGAAYAEPMGVPRIFDRLVATGDVPPFVAVFVGWQDRLDEYARSDAWLRFMATELVPAIDAKWRTRRTASDRMILGSSLGAVGATRLALAHPDVFGRIAALAPSEGAAEAVAAARGTARPDRRWFVMGGRYDRLLPDAQRLADRLREAREPVTYLEVPEGHSRETFRGHLDDALRSLSDARNHSGGTPRRR